MNVFADATQGLDLEKLAARKDLVFLDGLSGLFTGFVRKDNNRRGHGVGTTVLTDAGLDGVRDAIVSAAQGLKTSSGLQEDCKIVLVVDNLDFLLAASGGETTTWDAQNTLLGLREVWEGVYERVSVETC